MLQTICKSYGPNGFREDGFMFFPNVSLWELMTPACSEFGPHGHDWQDLCRPSLNIVTY